MATVNVTPQAAMQAPVLVQFYPHPPKKVYTEYKSSLSTTLGVLRILLAVGVFSLQTAGLVLVTSSYYFVAGWGLYVGAGYWTLPLFILSGTYGIVAAKYQSKCTIVAHMVLSIVSASVGAPLLLMFSASALGDAASSLRDNCDNCIPYDYYDDCFTRNSCDQLPSVIGISASLCVAALILAALDITASTLCCKVMCCGTGSHDNVQDLAPGLPSNAQLIQIPGGQYYAYPGAWPPQQSAIMTPGLPSSVMADQPTVVHGQVPPYEQQGTAQAQPDPSSSGEQEKRRESPPPAYEQ